jgi:hypothetical protein
MAATFTTLVTSFCEKLEAAKDIAEFDALDLTIESDYSRFRKKDFDELMAKCKAANFEGALDNCVVGDHSDLINSSIAQFYIATAHCLKIGAPASLRPIWATSFARKVFMTEVARDHAVPNSHKLPSHALGKPPVFTGNNTRHWVAIVKNYVEAQGINDDQQKLRVGVSFLGTNIQSHWSSYAVTHPSPTFDDFQQFLFDFYDKNVGVTEARRRWQAVRQGSKSVQEYALEFHSALADLTSMPNGEVTENEKITNFLNGLRASLHSQCRINHKTGRAFDSYMDP